jgi:hypothetical protein
MIAFGLSLPLMLLWLGLYLRQFGSFGVIRRKPKPEPALAAEATAAGEGEPEGATTAPQPTFAEAVTARGGLGRFSAFFRSGDKEQPAEEAIETGDTDSERSSTDEVIAAITTRALDPGSEKRLEPDDPLVTDVMGERPLEDALPRVTLPEPDVEAEPAPETTATHETATGSEQDSSAQPEGREEALDTLRKRRIQRLAQHTTNDQ